LSYPRLNFRGFSVAGATSDPTATR